MPEQEVQEVQDKTQSVKRSAMVYWNRRFIFACDHHIDRYFPVRGYSSDEPGSTPLMIVPPFFIPLRLGRDCSACVRCQVLDRATANVHAVRAGFASLRDLLDRCLKKGEATGHGDDSAKALLGDGDSGSDDEAWPLEPPSLDSLLQRSGSSPDDSGEAGRSSLPKGKLSDNIRTIREDLERRMQAWSHHAKSSRAGEAAVDESKAEATSVL